MLTCIVGAYTLLTMEGSIVFDGALASFYAYAFCHHDLDHNCNVKIFQLFPTVIKWILSHHECQHDTPTDLQS